MVFQFDVSKSSTEIACMCAFIVLNKRCIINNRLGMLTNQMTRKSTFIIDFRIGFLFFKADRFIEIVDGFKNLNPFSCFKTSASSIIKRFVRGGNDFAENSYCSFIIAATSCVATLSNFFIILQVKSCFNSRDNTIYLFQFSKFTMEYFWFYSHHFTL